MTQIEFYSLSSDDIQPAFEHLIEEIKLAYRKGEKIFVHTENRKLAETIDELLWTQDVNSFLPHQLVNEDADSKPPIEIGFGQKPNIRPDLLINLGGEVPLFFSRFNRVLEYAYGEAENKDKARERFRFYRDRGYPLKHKTIC